jgi:RNA polymerase sigma-70 factor (ECF subfamily)
VKGPHAADLKLAAQCLEGDDAAVRTLEERHLPQTAKALAKNGFEAALIDDVLDWLRFELFAREKGALLATYSGRSPIDGWLKAIAIHEALRRSKKRRKEVALEAANELPLAEPELGAMRGRYGKQFTRALSAGFQSLELAQRNLLRQYFLDGCSIDVLARMHRVHRATAARRVTAAREALVTLVKARLKEELKISDQTVDEVITLSNLEQSLSALLRKTG